MYSRRELFACRCRPMFSMDWCSSSRPFGKSSTKAIKVATAMRAKPQNYPVRLNAALLAPKFRSPLFLERFNALAEIGRIENPKLQVSFGLIQFLGVGFDRKIADHDLMIARG